MPGPARSVVTAVDATPLLGMRTGVGVSVAGFIAAASTDPALDLVAYGLSASAGRSLPDVLPGAVRAGRAIPIPATALLRRWGRAARRVTVHDLPSVHFPELCSPTSLRDPGLIRRALGQGASVHTVSQSMADEIVDHFRIDPGRVHVVH